MFGSEKNKFLRNIKGPPDRISFACVVGAINVNALFSGFHVQENSFKECLSLP